MTAAQRETQILDVAEALFTEHGLEGVTIEDIARAAGVSRPIVYQHHGTKEQVFLACVRRARRVFEQELSAALSEPSDNWADAIRAGGEVFYSLIERDPHRWNLLFASSASFSGPLSDELTALREATIRALADAIAPYAPEVDRTTFDAAAHALSGIGEQIGRWWLTRPDLSRDEILAYYGAACEGTLHGLLNLVDGRD